MKLSTALAAATAVALLSVPSAYALDLDVDLGADVSVDLGVVGVDLDAAAGVSASGNANASDNGAAAVSVGKRIAVDAAANTDEDSANGEIEIGEIISLIERSDWNETSLDAVADVNAEIVDADELAGEATAEFDAAVKAQAEEIGELHAALAANAALSAWLESEDVSAQSVVALGVKADGSLAVITSADEDEETAAN